jgi:hypothetical protein
MDFQTLTVIVKETGDSKSRNSTEFVGTWNLLSAKIANRLEIRICAQQKPRTGWRFRFALSKNREPTVVSDLHSAEIGNRSQIEICTVKNREPVADLDFHPAKTGNRFVVGLCSQEKLLTVLGVSLAERKGNEAVRVPSFLSAVTANGSETMASLQMYTLGASVAGAAIFECTTRFPSAGSAGTRG